MGNQPGRDIIVPRLKNLISVSGVTRKDQENDQPVQGLCFEGLTFMHADRDIWQADDVGIQHDWEMEDKDNALILFKVAENCKVHNCVFTSSGGNAIRLDYHCQNIEVTNNQISHLGQGGVVLIGYGPGTKDVIPYLHTRNTIIEHKEIENAANMLGDGSAINVSGSGEGNIIRRNFVHSINNTGVSGMMRTDDYQKGTVFQENILYNSRVGGITLKGENQVINNYFVNVGTAQGDLTHSAPGWGPFDRSVIKNNIFFVPGERQKFFYRFQPQDVNALSECQIDHNIYYCARSEATAQEPFLQALREAGHDRHSLYRDPLFLNWQEGNFNLHQDSPVRSLGIKRLSLRTVGLTDEFPRQWKQDSIF